MPEESAETPTPATTTVAPRAPLAELPRTTAPAATPSRDLAASRVAASKSAAAAAERAQRDLEEELRRQAVEEEERRQAEEQEQAEEDEEPAGVYYANCAAARKAGAAPLYRGDPGYRPGLDRDGDGDACE